MIYLRFKTRLIILVKEIQSLNKNVLKVFILVF